MMLNGDNAPVSTDSDADHSHLDDVCWKVMRNIPMIYLCDS